MTSKIDICSMALLKLGEKPIVSFSDDCASAQLARTLYDSVSDTLISLYPWRFATQKITLVKNSDNNFLIPSNVVRVLKSCGEIIGDRIFADGDTIEIVGLVKTMPEKYPTYFISLLSTRLAMEFCIPLTGDNTMFRTLVALYETELQNAKFIDSTTSKTTTVNDFSLVSVRF